MPAVLGVVATAVLTRALPPTVYGRYGASLAISALAVATLFDPIALALARFHASRASDPRTLPTFAALFAWTTVAASIPASLAALIGPSALRPLAAATIVLAVGNGAFELSTRVEIVRFRPGRTLLMSTVRAVLAATGATAAAINTGSAAAAIAATALAYGVACLLGPVDALRPRRSAPDGPGRRRRDRAPARPPIDRALARDAARFALPYAVSCLLLALSATAWRLGVGLLDGARALGLATAAAAIGQTTIVLLGAAIATATYPRAVAALEAGDVRAFRRQLASNWTILLGALLPAAAGIALTAPDLAALLAGPAYRDGVASLLPAVAAASLVGALRSCHLDHAFQLGRRPGLQVGVAASNAAAVLVLTPALLGAFGLEGAALATLGANAVGFGHAAWLGRRRATPMPMPRAPTLGIAVATALMAVAVALVPGHGWQALALRVAVGGAVYAAAILPVARYLTTAPAPAVL